MKRIYEGNKIERHRQSTAAFRARDPDRSRKQWRDYKKRSVEQKADRPKPEHCEICGSSGRICFDHDHKTGKFRGWLCVHCNLIIGKAIDNAELLRKLADYLDITK